MTLFAVACAGLFPLLHLGRIWVFYWLFPYPNVDASVAAIPQPAGVGRFCRQHLFHDFADLLVRGSDPGPGVDARSRRNRIGRVAYGMLALGWRGASRHWQRYQTAYLLLGGLAAPLVISVHSVVGMDFAGAIVPGWHTTIMPPYFVAGAIFSGFAMVLTLAIPLRAIYGLHDFITVKHIDNCGKLMLVTGLIVAYGYGAELFMGWYSGDPSESYLNLNHAFGPYAWSYWTILSCNVLHSAVALVPAGPAERAADVFDVDHRADRHVDRAICDRHRQPAS